MVQEHNANRSYQDQVKPFNFMCGFQASPLAATGEEFVIGDGSKSPRKTKQPPLATDRTPFSDEQGGFRPRLRSGYGTTIAPNQWKTYAQALAQYHLRPRQNSKLVALSRRFGLAVPLAVR